MERFILTAAEMRAAEQGAIDGGTSVETLMVRAGAAVAEAAWRFAGPLPTLILCGPGNNGGDGYVAARLLKARGVSVRVAALGPPKAGAAAAARARWDGPVEPLISARGAPLLIDALFGTGLTRELEPAVEIALGRLAGEARLAIAVDLPSGVETDGGVLLGQVPRFDLTVALGALKPAHRLQPAAALCGRVAVADIGIEIESVLSELGPPPNWSPSPGDHKYSRGMVAITGGVMPGASALAALAAARVGAGYVLYMPDERVDGLPLSIVQRLKGERPETDERVRAIVIGPGLGRDAAAKGKLLAALSTNLPIVVDGDGIHLLRVQSRLERLSGRPCVLTPHEGEFRALFGELAGSKIDRARSAAMRANAVVVYKGADTVVAAPDGGAVVSGMTSPWLSTAGTGDVLAGAIGGLLARGLPAFEAAKAGVWLHTRAAERLGPGLIADDLAAAL